VLQKNIPENNLNAVIDLAPAVDFAALDYVFILPPINIYQ
jgi:hypothetical protein